MLALMLAFLGVGAAPSADVAAPLQADLSTDRSTYRVGEPVRLTYRISNHGDHVVFLYPAITPSYSPKKGRLLYCTAAGCQEFFVARPLDEWKKTIRTRTALKPGQTMTSEFTVAYNPASSRLVLAEPGELEFRWENESLALSMDGPSVGRVVAIAPTIRIEAPDSEDGRALGEYIASGSARIADFETASSTIKDADLYAAKTLLAHFPTSLYASHVRAGLRRHLEFRKISGVRELSGEEADLLRQVKDLNPPS